MTPEQLADLAHLRRARDLMDREYMRPLDVDAIARAALMSTAHFSRRFRAAYRARDHTKLASVPNCIAKDVTRPAREPSRIGETLAPAAP